MNICFIGDQNNAGPREAGRQNLGDLAPNVKTMGFPAMVFSWSNSQQNVIHTLSWLLKMSTRERLFSVEILRLCLFCQSLLHVVLNK